MSEPVVEVLQAAGDVLKAPGPVGAGLNVALVSLAGVAGATLLSGPAAAPPAAAPLPATAWAGATDDALLAALARESGDDKGALSVVTEGGGE